MNPAELIQELDALRCQTRDARDQLARDSATISRLRAERDELAAIVQRCLDFWEAPNPTFGCGAKRQSDLQAIKSDARAALAGGAK